MLWQRASSVEPRLPHLGVLMLEINTDADCRSLSQCSHNFCFIIFVAAVAISKYNRAFVGRI